MAREFPCDDITCDGDLIFYFRIYFDLRTSCIYLSNCFAVAILNKRIISRFAYDRQSNVD